MFDLEKEVAAWSEALHARRCRSAADVAETVDHLYCEIDLQRAEGRSDEEAFRLAVAKLGAQPDLAAEAAKNRSLLASACSTARHERPARAQGPFLITHALLWAALMLGTSLVLSRSRVPNTASLVLVLVLIPGWWTSEHLLRRVLRDKPTGGA
jgi:hypothetical protein